jgi:hypothetical protein
VAARRIGAVEAGVKRDIAEIARRDPKLSKSGLAASAIVLAQSLDDSTNSATSKAMSARALREALDRLRELAPPVEQPDGLDALQRRSKLKLAGNGR